MMKTIKEKLIVSVDDYGIRNVSDAILPLVRKGKIDRVSVLINYVDSPEQVKELSESGVRLDLHLELIQMIKSGEKVKENALTRGINFLVRYIFGFAPSEEVEKVWITQIERFKKMFGRYPDGLNSHEHVHYFPRFFRIALRLGERYDIPFIRFGHGGILEKKSAIVARVLDTLWKKNKATYLKAKHIQEPADFFVSYDWIKDIDDFIKRLPEGRTEITFHPEKKNEYDAIDTYF